jgi:hypothetical protein
MMWKDPKYKENKDEILEIIVKLIISSESFAQNITLSGVMQAVDRLFEDLIGTNNESK